jgi:hypothetical protein
MTEKPVTLAPVLGVEPARFAHVPAGATSALMFGVYCMTMTDVQPTRLEVWKTLKRAQQSVTWSLTRSSWYCSHCQEPLQGHRPLAAETFREQRALDLQAGAPEVPMTAATKGKSKKGG